MDLLILAVLACTALSGFFALCDYSLRSFKRSQLEDVFGSDSGRKRLDRFDRNLSVLRVTVSFCRVAANAALIIVMLRLIAPEFSGAWIVVSVAASCGIIALFGIAIPHALALCAGEKIIAKTFTVLLVLRYMLFFLPDMMIAMELPIRRLLGADVKDDASGEVAKQEILQAVTEGHAEGAVDPEEVEMIESVIEFGDTQTGEIMTPRTDIFAMPADTRRDDAARQIVEAGHSRVPLYEGDMDNIIGILYAKDLLWPVDSPPHAPLREIMRKPYFVPETKPLDDLLREFKTRKVHIAVVLDEYGGTAGLVTIEDLVEEIVGDISDEYDRAEPALMTRLDAKTAEVDGRMHIDDLNDAMELSISEEEDYDTMAGFVFSELGYIPEIGEELVSDGVKFTILAADERKITRLRVEIGETEEPNSL